MKTSSSFFSKQKRDAMRMMQTPKGMFLFALRQGIGFALNPGIGSGLASMQGLLSDPSVSGRATAAGLFCLPEREIRRLSLHCGTLCLIRTGQSAQPQCKPSPYAMIQGSDLI